MSRVPANKDQSARKRRRDEPSRRDEEEDSDADEIFDAPFGMIGIMSSSLKP